MLGKKNDLHIQILRSTYAKLKVSHSKKLFAWGNYTTGPGQTPDQPSHYQVQGDTPEPSVVLHTP